MADGSYNRRRLVTDKQLDKDIEAEIVGLRILRRAATIDAICGFIGCPLALFHAFAEWSPLFELLWISWLPYAVSAFLAFWGTYSAVDAIRLKQQENALS